MVTCLIYDQFAYYLVWKLKWFISRQREAFQDDMKYLVLNELSWAPILEAWKGWVGKACRFNTSQQAICIFLCSWPSSCLGNSKLTIKLEQSWKSVYHTWERFHHQAFRCSPINIPKTVHHHKNYININSPFLVKIFVKILLQCVALLIHLWWLCSRNKSTQRTKAMTWLIYLVPLYILDLA